jgi:hypothetical protein
MPRAPAKFTQADIARGLRAVKASGVAMAVEISQDGKIRLEPVDGAERPEQYRGEIKLW